MKTWLYSFLVYLHVASVISSIGPYAVLYPLLHQLKEAKHHELSRPLSLFRFVVWISKHAGHMLVITGVLLWWLGRFSLWTSWIIIPIAILLSALFFLARAFSPVIRALEKREIDRETAVKKLRHAINAYLIILLVSMWFMIAKPVMW